MKSYQKDLFGEFQGQNIFRFTFENDLCYQLWSDDPGIPNTR